jgi:CHAD domain-containing protein
MATDFNLQPDMRADEAARLILGSLLAAMRATEAGIKADADVEFLHDFRVAVRRTHSALSQLRKVFPKRQTRHFKRQFRGLGRLTNELRDLDICLAAGDGFPALLPESMREDIEPLIASLRAHRTQALASVVTHLDSAAYAGLIASWERFLNAPQDPEKAANAAVPIYHLARKRLARQYRTVVKAGTPLLTTSDPRRLHALRLECKELRYLLEFFASLFPPDEIGPFISDLKRLQDTLGAIIDLSVQRRYLLSHAGVLALDESPRRRVPAVSVLIKALDRRQEQEKKQFVASFAAFTSLASQQQFRQLFGDGKTALRGPHAVL